MLITIDKNDIAEEYAIKSSNVLHIKYRYDIEKMTITYKSGKQYLYHNIPKTVFQKIITNNSIGSAIHEHIIKTGDGKNKYNESVATILNEQELNYLYNIINNYENIHK